MHCAVRVAARYVCSECMVRWPCLAVYQSVTATSSLDNYCQRCNGLKSHAKGRRICRDCASAERRLNEHWEHAIA